MAFEPLLDNAGAPLRALPLEDEPKAGRLVEVTGR